MKEVFKDIGGCSYQVSNLGRVKSLQRHSAHSKGGVRVVRGKILKNSINKIGYYCVNLKKDGKQKPFNIHQLVAEAFLNHKPSGHKIVVDHIDNNPLNNNVDNLQLISQRLNCSKDKKRYSSKYTGVSWNKVRQKWIACIKINGKDKYLGGYSSELEASNTYQKKLRQL